MIKITSGVYGYKKEDGSIQPKTSKDAPFLLPEKEERRLVIRGVAVYMPVEDAPKMKKPEYDADMNINSLRALMKDAGLKAPAGMKKEAMISELDQFYSNAVDDPDTHDLNLDKNVNDNGESENMREEDDEDSPPNPNAEDPIS